MALGRTLTLSGSHLPQTQNKGFGQDDLSEVTFNPDFLGVVNSVGTIGPVSSSKPGDANELRAPFALIEVFLLKEKIESFLKGKCIILTDRARRKHRGHPLAYLGLRLASQCPFAAHTQD